MSRREREVSDRKEIDSYIDQIPICRLGLVDGEEAYIVPLNFGRIGDDLYFHSAKEGRKIDLVRKQGRASFEMDLDLGTIMDHDAFRCTNQYVCIMGTGRVVVVEDEKERLEGLEALMRHYRSSDHTFSEKCLSKTSVLRLRIESISCKRNVR